MALRLGGRVVLGEGEGEGGWVYGFVPGRWFGGGFRFQVWVRLTLCDRGGSCVKIGPAVEVVSPI